MLRLIIDENLDDAAFVAAETRGIAELRSAVEPYTPVEVARRADVPVEDFVAATRMFANARRGVAVAGTAPGMSSARGTLVEYLILALNAICGRYLRAGEEVWNPGTLVEAVPRFAQALPPFPSYGLPPMLRVRDLKRYGRVNVEVGEPRYRRPLLRHLEALAPTWAETQVVLLGSVASPKYVELLTRVLGERVAFPAEFVGRGDMSRGGLMLRCVSQGRELSYVPLVGAVCSQPGRISSATT